MVAPFFFRGDAGELSKNYRHHGTIKATDIRANGWALHHDLTFFHLGDVAAASSSGPRYSILTSPGPPD